MESQHTRETDKNRDNSEGMAGTAGSHGASGNRNALNQGQGGGSDEGGTMEQAKTMVRNVGEQAMSIASTATSTAQDLARRAREQTTTATDTLYQQGTQASQYLTRNVNAYPMTALLVAGAIGYGLGYLIHNGWTSEGWSGSSDNDRHGSNDRNRRRHD